MSRKKTVGVAELFESFYPYLKDEEWEEFFRESKEWNKTFTQKKNKLKHEDFIKWVNEQSEGDIW